MPRIVLAECAYMPTALVLVLHLVGSGEASSIAEPGNFTVAAYLPEWRYEGANWEDIAEVVDHLILFSMEVQPSGRLSAFDRLPRKELMQEARAATRAAGSKLLVCVGGNGRSAGFSSAVAGKERRSRFVNSLISLLDRYDLDGVDLNWEYPGYDFKTGYASDEVLERDYRGLGRLLKQLHVALAPQGRILTMAYYPDSRQEGLIEAHRFPQYVDLMHMMSYDQQGRHSTWEFGDRVARQGARMLPPAQVTLGLPFYGRHVQTGDWKSYEDLIQANPMLSESEDEVSGYFFNGPKLIRRKTRLARELGLGGVMIWEVGQDCRQHAVTHGETTHAVTCPLQPCEDGELGDCPRGSLLAAIHSEVGSRSARFGDSAPAKEEL